MGQAINIVFDVSKTSGEMRFVEVEKDNGESISVGKWIERNDGLLALRIKNVI